MVCVSQVCGWAWFGWGWLRGGRGWWRVYISSTLRITDRPWTPDLALNTSVLFRPPSQPQLPAVTTTLLLLLLRLLLQPALSLPPPLLLLLLYCFPILSYGRAKTFFTHRVCCLRWRTKNGGLGKKVTAGYHRLVLQPVSELIFSLPPQHCSSPSVNFLKRRHPSQTNLSLLYLIGRTKLRPFHTLTSRLHMIFPRNSTNMKLQRCLTIWKSSCTIVRETGLPPCRCVTAAVYKFGRWTFIITMSHLYTNICRYSWSDGIMMSPHYTIFSQILDRFGDMSKFGKHILVVG